MGQSCPLDSKSALVGSETLACSAPVTSGSTPESWPPHPPSTGRCTPSQPGEHRLLPSLDDLPARGPLDHCPRRRGEAFWKHASDAKGASLSPSLGPLRFMPPLVTGRTAPPARGSLVSHQTCSLPEPSREPGPKTTRSAGSAEGRALQGEMGGLTSAILDRSGEEEGPPCKCVGTEQEKPPRGHIQAAASVPRAGPPTDRCCSVLWTFPGQHLETRAPQWPRHAVVTTVPWKQTQGLSFSHCVFCSRQSLQPWDKVNETPAA